MNPLKGKQIRELRLNGAGYRSIASIVGLTRDMVRNYCKKHNLAGNASVLTRNLNKDIEDGVVCLYCGKRIIQSGKGRHRKFCSDLCRREWWQTHPEKLHKKDTAIYECRCKYCGEKFISYGNKNRRYCSHNCYIKDRFWKE
ncbi:MAG: RNA polymerase subunit sigma-70 [Clostridiales bacterium]|nr:RNA polymerase subunit sigma-70 [Clostridiales bacterium]